MMTLDAAIEHAEEVAEEYDKLCKANDSFNFSQPRWKECANEHRQLAEWLKELKQLREHESCEDAIIIPEVATNGDVIKAVFPNAEYKEDILGNVFVISSAQLGYIAFRESWWNALYKE